MHPAVIWHLLGGSGGSDLLKRWCEKGAVCHDRDEEDGEVEHGGLEVFECYGPGGVNDELEVSEYEEGAGYDGGGEIQLGEDAEEVWQQGCHEEQGGICEDAPCGLFVADDEGKHGYVGPPVVISSGDGEAPEVGGGPEENYEGDK